MPATAKHISEGDQMAKPNFKFQKRQKELDRKKKQDEKLLRKQEKAEHPAEDEASLPVTDEDDLNETAGPEA